jgi:hypothetical protein
MSLACHRQVPGLLVALAQSRGEVEGDVAATSKLNLRRSHETLVKNLPRLPQSLAATYRALLEAAEARC